MTINDQTKEWDEIIGPYNGSARYPQIKKVVKRILEDNLYTLSTSQPPIRAEVIAENYGLDVGMVAFPESSRDVSGVINITDKVIVVNDRDPSNRQTFTVAHEFGHYVLHRDIVAHNPKLQILYRTPLRSAGRDPIESEANYFAANLLVPARMLSTLDNLGDEELAKIFAVSQEVIAYRKLSEKMEKL